MVAVNCQTDYLDLNLNTQKLTVSEQSEKAEADFGYSW